ncbi:YaeQ family protein [Glutamicibacter protophormiae]|uniref:YaeQ family protein n=1 Tax=Glutamicibacter protophormiae TaxID=37930 RepID=UPI002A83C222|nr:YaeQ family protein [Glutamicibacter protophormiae]WPR65176.1 YaeQ family protein [Glutamicibacter protophormiae]WPR68673.1 YaeQ family protein [Glutamicibacter protophormiae]
MAIGATIRTFDIQLSDMDRGVYEELSLRVAQHPSETDAYLVTRVLAYCLEFEEGIAFAAAGVSSGEEPAVLVKDLTGLTTAWIEVGAPDAQRLHTGSKLADRAAVYTHRDPQRLLASWNGKTIHRAQEIVVRSFDSKFIDAAAAELTRRNIMSLSVTEGQLYLELNGASLETQMREHQII